MFKILVRRALHLGAAAVLFAFLLSPAPARGALIDFQRLQILFDGAGLRGASAVEVSPDGAQVYAVGGPGCLSGATRDPSTGTLSFLQVLCEIEAEVEGLDEVRDIVSFPDGEHLYVAALGLTVLDRDPATGLFELTDRVVEGQGGATGIARPDGLVVSGDGAFVYVADYAGDAVSVFARDSSTGGLSFVQALFDGQGGVSGIALANHVALSPDGAHLYVAAGGASGSVAVFDRDAGTGTLSFVQAILDGQDGATGLAGARAVDVSPDGDHVYVVGPVDSAVTVFARDGGTGMLSHVQTVVDGLGGVSLLANPLGLRIRPDGSVLVVNTFPDNALVVFARDAMTGMLTLVEESTGVTLGTDLNNPGPPAFDPNGDHLYSASRFEEAIVAAASAPATGALSFVQLFADESAHNDGLEAVEGLVVSADGRHLYTTSSDGEREIGRYERDAATGLLTFVESLAGDSLPVSIDETAVPTLSPGGEHLYVSELSTPNLIVFDRDAVSGALTFASATPPQSGAIIRAMAFSADGRFLYAGDDVNDAVQVYGRDPVTGALAFLQTLVDGVDAEGLNDPLSLALSLDGTSLYVCGDDDNAIAHFSRNATTGLLTFVGQVVDGVGGVEGLDGVRGLAMSSDGAQLYAVSDDDDAIAVFSRGPSSGTLTFEQVLADGVDDVDGLDSVRTVSVTPDGKLVVAGSGIDPSNDIGDQAIVLFLRDTADGSLRFGKLVDRSFDTSGDLTDLNAVSDMVVTADGAHLVTAHQSASALTVSRLPFLIFADGFESGDTTSWSSILP
ncbi:MAG: beta-propeller fold lactonase family protein [Acidobacteriota bacterium]